MNRQKVIKVVLIVVGVYFIVKVWDTYRTVKATGEAIKQGAASTAKAPVNATSSLLAVGALGYDLARGQGWSQSWSIFKDTVKNVWSPKS